MLTLILEGKWFDMIKSGEKGEEYRDIKDYYTTCFQNAGLIDQLGCSTYALKDVIFQRGYAKDAPRLLCRCICWRGQGKEKWGALPGKSYYVLTIFYKKELMPDDHPE